MKIVFFSDIHGNKYVLPQFLIEIKKEKPDSVVFCGDVFGYYYHQNEILNVFRQNKFVTLLGNHDQYFLDVLKNNNISRSLIEKYGNSYKDVKDKISKENIAFLEKLKPFYKFRLKSCKVAVFHGSIEDPLNGRVYPNTEIKNTMEYEEYDYVILGHTHHKMVKKIGTTTILNPGSIGQQRDGKGCSYLILDTDQNKYSFKKVEFPVEKLVKDIDRYDNGNLRLKEVLFRKS